MATATHPPQSHFPANWASGAFCERELPLPPAKPTEFELVTERLGISNAPHLWAHDAALRVWVKKHRNNRYIPESLLDQLGIGVCVEDYL